MCDAFINTCTIKHHLPIEVISPYVDGGGVSVSVSETSLLYMVSSVDGRPVLQLTKFISSSEIANSGLSFAADEQLPRSAVSTSFLKSNSIAFRGGGAIMGSTSANASGGTEKIAAAILIARFMMRFIG